MKIRNTVKILAVLLIVAMCIPYLQGCSGNSGYVSVNFDKVSGKLDNPGMGWSITEDGTFLGVLDNGETGDYPEVDAINYTSTWALMEPEEGVYDFSLLDEAIEKWGIKCGKTLHLRISTDSFMLPSTYTGAPYWLSEKYNVPTQYMDYTSVSPVKQAVTYDVTDENYLRCLDAFLSALAEHLKGVSCIGDIDIRGYGLWGEWHTGYVFPTTAEKRNALITLLDKWVDMFAENGNVMVLSASWDPNYIDSYGAASGDAYGDFWNWAALDYAFTLDNVTFRRDGAGGALLEVDKQLMAEVVRSGKNVYLHGEFNSGAEAYTSSSASIDSMTAVNDMLYSLRCNYSTIIGWTASTLNTLLKEDKVDWLDRGFEKLGYRLYRRSQYPEYRGCVSRQCEGDLTSTVSQLLLSYIAEDITMLMDLSAMDESDDSILMWHCGPAAKRFCEKKGYTYSLNYSGKDHEGRDLDHAVGTGITRDMVFDDDVYTIARLTGESDKMFVASGVMQDGTKSSYNGSRGWMGQLKLNRQDISALDFFNTIMAQGFQHHFPLVKGDYTEEIMEVMAWLGLKPVEKVPYENYLQR